MPLLQHTSYHPLSTRLSASPTIYLSLSASHAAKCLSYNVHNTSASPITHLSLSAIYTVKCLSYDVYNLSTSLFDVHPQNVLSNQLRGAQALRARPHSRQPTLTTTLTLPSQLTQSTLRPLPETTTTPSYATTTCSTTRLATWGDYSAPLFHVRGGCQDFSFVT